MQFFRRVSLLGFFTIYHFVSFSQIDSTNLPLVIIDTYGQPIVDEPKTDGWLKIIYNTDKFNKPSDSANIYNGNAGIEIRGAYSASLPQKPYGIETRDGAGSNLNVPMFHMPAENDWILLANYNDKVFMRNTLAFDLFHNMGHYAPRTMFCEAVVNGQYQGIYVFTEKIKQDKGRVDIADLTPDENSGDNLTGGYIFKIDYYDGSNSWESSFPPMGYADKKVYFVYCYPKPEDISSTQKTYLRNFVKDFETVIYSPNTPTQKAQLETYLDEDSFIDYFLLNELARNVDGYKKSAYFYKDKDGNDGRIHAGPVWDFDWAWKNINECYFGATDGSGWAFLVHQCNNWPTPPTWMNKLLADRSFARKTADRYFTLRETILSESYLYGYIDSVATVLDAAQNRHYSKWQILGQNVGAPEVDAQPTTYAGEVAKFKKWIGTRLRWLDMNIASFIVTSTEDELINSQLKIYPNPAHEYVNIHSDEELLRVDIVSSLGNTIISQIARHGENVSLPIESLTPGVYFAKLTFADGRQQMEKLIKE